MTESQELQYLRGKCSNLEQGILDLRETLRNLMAQCEAENEVAGYMVINLGRAEDIMEKIKEVK
jgi:hypothetical protein